MISNNISKTLEVFKTYYYCPNCKYSTDRKNNLKRHLSTMHESSPKVLECCGVNFVDKSSLKEHVSYCHATKGYTCLVCQKRFSRKALLKRHSVIHDQSRSLKCHSCDYSTCHKSNLDRHSKKHSNFNHHQNRSFYSPHLKGQVQRLNSFCSYLSCSNQSVESENCLLPVKTKLFESRNLYKPNIITTPSHDAYDKENNVASLQNPLVPVNFASSVRMGHEFLFTFPFDKTHDEYLKSFFMKQFFFIYLTYYNYFCKNYAK